MKFFSAKILTTAAASLVFTAAGSTAVFAQGVAFITDIKGEATLGTGRAAIMAEVGKGARISCLKECQVGVMYLLSGQEFTLKGPGDFVVGDTEVAAKIGAPPKLRDTQWKITAQTVKQASQTSNASIRMRSIGDSGSAKPEEAVSASRLLYPLGTAVVSMQPTFRWTATSARVPYDFELKTAAAPDKPVYKAKSREPSLKLPASIKLQADTEYWWSVKSANTEIGNSTFKTLSTQALALAQTRKPADKAEFSDWLMYGLTLREVGASQDASVVFGKLAKDRPDLPELARLAQP